MAITGVPGAAQAAAAYAATARGEAVPGPAQGAGSFGAMLSRAMEGAVEAGRGADVAASQAMAGQGGVTEAVLAISRAELALQTTVALRDRVVAAYQDVMRMPI